MSSRAKPKTSKFNKLKEQRKNGEVNKYEAPEERPIFDLVSDENWNSMAKMAMLEDDFVVDDNGEGYTQGGLENWDDRRNSSDSDEEMEESVAEIKKRKRVRKENIVELFNNHPKVPTVKPLDVGEIDLMDSILSSLGGGASQTVLPKRSQPTAFAGRPRPTTVRAVAQTRAPLRPLPLPSIEAFLPIPVPERTFDNDVVMDYNDDIPVVLKPVVKETAVRGLQTRKPSKKVASFLPKFELEEKGFATVVSIEESNNTKWKDLSIPVSAVEQVTSHIISGRVGEVLETDGSLYFYWIDAFEKNGIIYLFGKVKEKSSYISCCVTVQGMDRNLYVLPRKFKLNSDMTESNVEVTMHDVYVEFDALRKKNSVTAFSSKCVNRKYAFEIPNIPAESDYLKVAYSYTEPQIDVKNLKGATFSHIFGAQTTALELFLLKRKIMGPCWIRIEKPSPSDKKISWCKTELIVSSPKLISMIAYTANSDAPKAAPPLVVMSLNLRTIMTKANEIVACSALVYDNGTPIRLMVVNIDSQTEGLVGKRFTILRPIPDVPWPAGFLEKVSHLKTRVDIEGNERALLSSLISMIFRFDPDVIVGHNFIDYDLDVLLQRMKVSKVDHWSRIGRLKRTVWPKLQVGAGGTGESTFMERSIASGRIICDTYRAAQDLVQSKTNSLTYLSATQLKVERVDIEYDKISSYFWDSELLLNMINHCEVDCYLASQLMFKFQVLPLTKQLTNLAGNLWSRTMMGARSERNEYLLLHEFHEKKYICPDKATFSVVDPTATKRKKAAFSGGLVLEPKKGLYDKYVMVLDFNSLYPSIIQEYNLCFTTVNRTQGSDVLPELPSQSLPQGILPRVLKSLVERRKAVKALLKAPDLTPTLYAQYDIRQKAIKLTANSMYGCLGFTMSRFSAKSIAMLVTSKGREILQNTVKQAEDLKMEVIYGDTDSIMINTNLLDLNLVKDQANVLKKAVNERYKLLEIEMDGFFQRLLLLKKKKYAALVATESDGLITTKLEYKGLDLVRRDWCDLSHEVSERVLKLLFKGANREEAILEIHEYLEQVGIEVRKELIPIESFVINKGLTKKPEDYADKETQPHVQVAFKMKAKGLSVKPGDTIPYIICIGESSSIAKRAYHYDEVVKDKALRIDLEWYLATQVHPPVARVCEPIEGTDNSRLALCLGLDSKKYKQMTVSNVEEDELLTLESQLTDAERFKDVVKWTPMCNHCKQRNDFNGLVNESFESSFVCQNGQCKRVMSYISLERQIVVAIRSHMSRYLDQSVVCDNSTCLTKTRFSGVYGRKCLVPHCSGLLSLEFTDRALYTQMQYFEYLVDDRAILERNPLKDYEIKSVLRSYDQHVSTLKRVVENYLQTSLRRWVDLGELFKVLL